MTSTAWSIRPGCKQDIDEVLALWLDAGSPPSATDTSEGLACLLAADGDALLIAEADGRLVGSLIAAWDGWRASFLGRWAGRRAAARGEDRLWKWETGPKTSEQPRF